MPSVFTIIMTSLSKGLFYRMAFLCQQVSGFLPTFVYDV